MSANLQYSIRVLIIHPTLTPDEISDTLKLNPDVSMCVGQPRRTPRGDPLAGVYPDTKWSVSEVRNGDRFFFRRVDTLLDRIGRNRDFLHRIAETGGTARFMIGLHGAENIGDALSEQSVAKLANLKGSLDVEVFPRMNPREDEIIWADTP